MLSGKHSEVSKNRMSIFTSADKSEVNLFSKLYKSDRIAPSTLTVNTITPLPGRIPFEEAIKGNFQTTKIGAEFLPSWSTHWFHITFDVPSNWKGEEVHLLWDCGCEALLWTTDGTPLQAFLGSAGEDRRAEYIITNAAKGGEKLDFYVELSCTAMFGNGKGNGWGGLGPNPTDLNKVYTLKQVEIAVHDRLAADLLKDFIIISDMVKLLPKDSFRAAQGLTIANKIMNAFNLDDRSTWEKCREIAKEFLSVKNSLSQHNVSAIGHCHIDTAWLWPYAETKRKCARSWASQLRICEKFPEYKFGCSQAQQFAWVKELYPKLYSEIKESAKKGQFVPIGGTWVEMDCNIPSGESLVRQFLFGQRFFKQEFGSQCNEFWLPDTLGYSAQLPQIIKSAEIDFFVTQKLSWAQFNKFPHHTFYWEGLDGSRVLTHFPPTDTYNAQTTIKDILFHLENFREKERSNESLMVFGHGDGGGGPLMSMVDYLSRMTDVDGLPKIEMRTPNQFFERVLKEAEDLAVWVGELYFEYHRGTYTSQAKNKLHNRLCEFLLRDIEFFSTISHVVNKDKFSYPTGKINELWELVLLNQFHDVIPGSSINEVYRDSDEHYAYVEKTGAQILQDSIDSLSDLKSGSSTLAVLNTLGWERTEVVALDNKEQKYVIASAPSMGYKSLDVTPSNNVTATPVTATQTQNNEYVLENEFVKAVFNERGQLVSYVDKKNKSRQVIEPNKLANQFVIYEDVPMYWDAWDVDIYHLEKRTDLNEGSVKILESTPLRSSLHVTLKISQHSSLNQVISLSCLSPRLDFETEVNWNESHKFLKVEFPLWIRSMKATYETQYGHLERPTHWNTSWDVAKFEVCGHKWADLSEGNYGVALLNDCKYGYATHNNVMRLSLLRAPKNPDPECDIGHHKFRYALLPHRGTIQDANLVREAFAFNVPLKVQSIDKKEKFENSFFSVNDSSVVIDAVKKAEDNSSVIVRLYESFGGRTSFSLQSSLPVKRVTLCNILEHDVTQGKHQVGEWKDGSVQIDMEPFQVLSLKLHF